MARKRVFKGKFFLDEGWKSLRVEVDGRGIVRCVEEEDGGRELFVPPFVDCHLHLTEAVAEEKWVDVSSLETEELKRRFSHAPEFYGVNLPTELLPLLEKWGPPSGKVVLKTRSHHSAYASPSVYREVMGREGGGVLAGEEHEEFFSRFSVSVSEGEYAAYLRKAVGMGIGALCPLEGGWRDGSEFSKFARSWEDLPRLFPFLQVLDAHRAAEEGWFGVGGCVLVDGAISARTAALWEDYADFSGKGILYLKAEDLLRTVRESAELGLWFTVHAIGDRAVSEVVKAYERAGGKGKLRLEHCVLAREEDLFSLSRMGVLLCFQPAFDWFFRDEYVAALGSERAKRTNPYRLYSRMGGDFVVGTDAPVTPLSPRWTLLAAADECEEALELVLKAYTHGAYAHLGLEWGEVKEGDTFVFLQYSEGFDYDEDDLGVSAFWFGSVDLLSSLR